MCNAKCDFFYQNFFPHLRFRRVIYLFVLLAKTEWLICAKIIGCTDYGGTLYRIKVKSQLNDFTVIILVFIAIRLLAGSRAVTGCYCSCSPPLLQCVKS